MCMSVFLHVSLCTACGGQKKALGFLDLELQTVVWLHVEAGIQTGSSGSAASTLFSFSTPGPYAPRGRRETTLMGP